MYFYLRALAASCSILQTRHNYYGAPRSFTRVDPCDSIKQACRFLFAFGPGPVLCRWGSCMLALLLGVLLCCLWLHKVAQLMRLSGAQPLCFVRVIKILLVSLSLVQPFSSSFHYHIVFFACTTRTVPRSIKGQSRGKIETFWCAGFNRLCQEAHSMYFK